jgi:hypothetical protein
MIKGAIYDFFDTKHPDAFKKFDNLQPLVTAQAVSLSRGEQRLADWRCLTAMGWLLLAFRNALLAELVARACSVARVRNFLCLLTCTCVALSAFAASCRTLTRCWCLLTTCRAPPTTHTMSAQTSCFAATPARTKPRSCARATALSWSQEMCTGGSRCSWSGDRHHTSVELLIVG